MPHPVDANLGAIMHQAFAVHARADACLVEEIDRHLLDDAGADAAEHIVAGMPLQDDVVDVVLLQQLAEQEARRPRPDDRDLRPHGRAFLADSIPGRQRSRQRDWNTGLVGRCLNYVTQNSAGLYVRQARHFTPSPHSWRGWGEGVTMIPYRNARAPHATFSPAGRRSEMLCVPDDLKWSRNFPAVSFGRFMPASDCASLRP